MKAKVVIAGINHFDPLGRTRIVFLLEELRNKDFEPDCIAVEWDREKAELVIKQRDSSYFYNKMKYDFPSLSNKNIIALHDTIAYEVDSHVSLYPNLPIIWLDEGRNDPIASDNDNIIKFAELRFKYYKGLLTKTIDLNSENLLEEVSLTVWENSNFKNVSNDVNTYERDKKFYYAIQNAIIAKRYKKIFVIVGANHADYKREASMATRLKKENIDVEVYIVDR